MCPCNTIHAEERRKSRDTLLIEHDVLQQVALLRKFLNDLAWLAFGFSLNTHILNIELSNNPPNASHARSLRNFLKSAIYEVQLLQITVFNQQGIHAVVTLVMSGVRYSSAWYYTDTYPNDRALAQHTNLALTDVRFSLFAKNTRSSEKIGISFNSSLNL